MLSQQVFPADLQVAFKWLDALAEGTLCQSCAGWCVSDPNEFLLFHGFIPGGAPHFENTSSCSVAKQNLNQETPAQKIAGMTPSVILCGSCKPYSNPRKFAASV